MKRLLVLLGVFASLTFNVFGHEDVFMFSNMTNITASVPAMDDTAQQTQQVKAFSVLRNGLYFLAGESTYGDQAGLYDAMMAVRYYWPTNIYVYAKEGYGATIYKLSDNAESKVSSWNDIKTDDFEETDYTYYQAFTISNEVWKTFRQYDYTYGKLKTTPYAIYLKYEPNKYWVQFNGNGATSGSMAEQQFTYDQGQTLNENKFERKYTVHFNSKDGDQVDSKSCAYTFAGWKTEKGTIYNDKATVSNLTSSTNSVTLSAQWKASSIELPTTTKSGYVLEGWYTTDGNRVGGAGEKYTPTQDITLFAQWEAATYTLTMNLNGAEWRDDRTTTNRYKAVAFQSPVGVLPKAAEMLNTKDSKFKGWFYAASGGTAVNENDTYEWAYDVIIYAQWEADEGFWVSEQVLPSDKAGYITPESGTHASGTTFTAVPSNGWSFAHWEDDSTNANRMIEYHGSIDISATFTGNVYVVTFMYEKKGKKGGECESTNETFGSNYILPNEDDGHNRYHWYFEDDFTGEEVTTNTEVRTSRKHTLYAKYVEDPKYTLAFDGNGAAGEMESISVYVGYATTLPSNKFARVGYQFKGWAESPEGEVAFTDGAEYESSAKEGDENTLYAVWQPITYQVKFDANGGSGDMGNQSFTYDVTNRLNSNGFTKSVHGFYCWTNEINNCVYEDGALVSNLCAIAGDTYELKAVWTNALTDLSKAMHCTNLIWENVETDGFAWEPINELGIGYGTDSCARLISIFTALVAESDYLQTKCDSAGTLSFYWKGAFANESKLQVNMSDGTEIYAFDIPIGEEGEWCKQEIKISDAGIVRFRVAKLSKKEDDTCGKGQFSIDQMTWTPGVSRPEPTEEDRPEIGNFTATDNGFSLTLSNVSEDFDYNLLGTNLLSAPITDWPIITNMPGTAETMTIPIPLDSNKASMFYKVQVIKKLE